MPAAMTAHTQPARTSLPGRKRGGLSYASQGPGSGGPILGAMLQKATGAPMTHVPYRGPAPAIVDLVAERVDFIYAARGRHDRHR
jgi:tripartite-type tricarboxylate transporter receptor subunit TctC